MGALEIEDAGEVGTEGFEGVGSDQRGVCRFDLDFEVVRGAEVVPTGISELDECGPAVGGVGRADNQALAFEIVDDVTGALFGHAGALGDGGDASALQIDMGQDGGMGRPDLVVSARAQKLDRMGAIGAVGLQEKTPNVMVADFSDLVALGVGWGHGNALDRLDN